MVVLLLTAAGQLTIKVIGLQQYQAEGGMAQLAQAMFSPYVFAFEATSALLITAAVGAMILAHRERLTPKIGQRAMALQRMQDYADSGKHPGPLAAPGVFARHNAVDTPGLLPDGTPARESISRVLAARGSIKPAPDDVEEIEQEILLPSDEREDDL
jgi:NADH-quinone oxidoreductase subunit J